jgi:glycosyltransferase involved in cell wall biosynthesis
VHVIGYRDPVGTAAVLAAQMAHVPYLIEPVGMYRRRIRSRALKATFDATLGRAVVRRAKAFVATSRLEVRELTQDGIPQERIRLRPNGVDVAGLLPLPERGLSRARFGLPLRAPLVLALGRITRKKGLPHLLEALIRLPDLWALIAGPDDGDGTLEEVLRSRARLGLAGRVIIHPTALWSRDKAEALAAADCFCLPSATENFGTAAAEAAAVGLPVVVSDLCGASEWLDPAASRTVPYGDVAALAVALSGLLDSRSSIEAARAAPRIRASLDWTALAEQQVEIYEETLRL